MQRSSAAISNSSIGGNDGAIRILLSLGSKPYGYVAPTLVSVTPACLQSSCIFTDYQRRFDDFISIYDKTCHAAAVLGAEYVVIHGAVAHPKIPIPDERYFDRFNKLIEIGKREGVTVCQENVNRFKSESIDFCKKMRAALGDDFHMVFDIKQTVRAGQNTFEFLEEFKN